MELPWSLFCDWRIPLQDYLTLISDRHPFAMTDLTDVILLTAGSHHPEKVFPETVLGQKEQHSLSKREYAIVKAKVTSVHRVLEKRPRAN